MAQIGIVIVTYFSKNEIGACLDAALQTGAEVLVVDNASSDGTAEAVAARGVRLVANSTNRGFAAAVNQGFSTLKSDYVLLLNPDAVIRTGLEYLREACDLPGSAGAGGILIGHDGLPQVGFMARALPTPAALVLELCLLNRIWPGNPVNRKYRTLDLDYEHRSCVEQPAGAFLMIRRAVWEELGGFDEGFFPVWFEDVDFCRRAVSRGYRFYYEPRAVAEHTGAHSISSLSLEMRTIYWYRSLLRYSAKHFRGVHFRAVCLAVLAGSCVRVIAETAIYQTLKPLSAYWRVARIASRSMILGQGHVVALSAPKNSR